MIAIAFGLIFSAPWFLLGFALGRFASRPTSAFRLPPSALGRRPGGAR